MRTPRESLLLLLLMTTACLGAGVAFGIGTGQFVKPPQATPTASAAPATVQAITSVPASVTPGVQKALLLIGVTDASAPLTQLEACWVITFRPGVVEYYVLAFPPSAQFEISSLAGPHTLRELHELDQQLQVNNNFVRDAVLQRFPAIPIQADVTLDRGDLSALVGQLGGLPINNQVLTGPTLLQTYDAWPAPTDMERLRFQGDVLNRLFTLLADRQWTAGNLTDFIIQIPRVNAEPAIVTDLQNFAHGAPPFEPDGLKWSTYGPEAEAGSYP